MVTLSKKTNAVLVKVPEGWGDSLKEEIRANFLNAVPKCLLQLHYTPLSCVKTWPAKFKKKICTTKGRLTGLNATFRSPGEDAERDAPHAHLQTHSPGWLFSLSITLRFGRSTTCSKWVTFSGFSIVASFKTLYRQNCVVRASAHLTSFRKSLECVRRQAEVERRVPISTECAVQWGRQVENKCALINGIAKL